MADISDIKASDRSQPVMGGVKKLNGTTSQLVKTGAGVLAGIFVNSTSAGTVKLWDALSAVGTIIVNTHTIAPGWNPMPFTFDTGLYITVGGTIDYSISYT
jgi:hypothetical protein